MGTLYENLVILCKQSGISGGKMCNDIGLSRGLMTDLKMGRRTGVSAETADKIAKYFKVPIEDVVNGKKKPPSQKARRQKVNMISFGAP